MTISIDSNVLGSLWNNADPFSAMAARALGQVSHRDSLVVTALVYSELMAGPLRTETALDEFFAETGISIDWRIGEDVWREAGRAYRGYAQRRKRSGDPPPRRILADFVIGAHAVLNGHTLLTIDKKHYAAAFPQLKIVSP
jgi:predicted nucleic acid-binding protein